MNVRNAVFKTVYGALLRRPGSVRFPSIPAKFRPNDSQPDSHHGAYCSWKQLANGGGGKVGRKMDSLRGAVREWRNGVESNAVVPLTLGVAGLASLGAYCADLLARDHVRSLELVAGWFAFRALEHRVIVPLPVLVLEGAFIAFVLVGATPWTSFRFEWWTRRRWALVVAIAIMSAGAISNLAEILQKGSVTDFLLIHNLGDFSAGDFLITTGLAGFFIFFMPPDYVGVRKRHVMLAIGAVVVSLVSLPLIRPPLTHLLSIALLLASVVWLSAFLWWRIGVGSRLLGMLATDVPGNPGPDTDRCLEAIELTLRRSAHIGLAASAWAMVKLSDAYSRLRRPEDLRRTADTFLRTAEEVNDDRMKARALFHIGFAYSLEDDPAQANRVWQECLRFVNRRGDDRRKLLLLANIAWTEGEMDRTDDAQRTYAAALELAERLGNTEMAYQLREVLSAVKRAKSDSQESGS